MSLLTNPSAVIKVDAGAIGCDENGIDADGLGTAGYDEANALILPAKRAKKNVEPQEEEQKAMSKRKRRALEAVAKKKARQSERGDILQGLKETQLTSQQKALMLPSAHTGKSRKEARTFEELKKAAGLSSTFRNGSATMEESTAKRAKTSDEQSGTSSAAAVYNSNKDLLLKRSYFTPPPSFNRENDRMRFNRILADNGIGKHKSRSVEYMEKEKEKKEPIGDGGAGASNPKFEAPRPGARGFLPTSSSTHTMEKTNEQHNTEKENNRKNSSEKRDEGPCFTAAPGMRNFFPPKSSSHSATTSLYDDTDTKCAAQKPQLIVPTSTSGSSTSIPVPTLPPLYSSSSTTTPSQTSGPQGPHGPHEDLRARRKSCGLAPPPPTSSNAVAPPLSSGRTGVPLEYPRVTRPSLNRSDDVQEGRHKLPAVLMEQEIVESVLENDVIVLCGDTGCGKSTQVPQFLYEAGFAKAGRKIAVTQPRRVATVSITKRVAQELNDPKLVEYQVRYDRSRHVGTKEDLRIKFMTDGILLKELQSDFMLRRYGVVVIDEAHERSINCDILIGLLSRVVAARRREYMEHLMEEDGDKYCPLKLIIMSATLRICDFTANTKLFNKPPPVINVDAKLYPVSIHFDQFTHSDYVETAGLKVRNIHRDLPPGSILVFVTGRSEVHRLCHLLKKRKERSRESSGYDTRFAEESSEDEAEFNDYVDLKSWITPPKKSAPDTNKILDEPLWSEKSFALDEDEGVERKLEADEVDGEAMRQKRIQLSKLDRSRTCKGLFTGGDGKGSLRVVPLYAQLPAEQQMAAFEPAGPDERIVVVATNVAETSVTIPNVRYVVDCGKEKKRIYNQESGVSRFDITWISKASANQRSGRCGRMGPGHCYRLYSSPVFDNEFVEFPRISILSTPIDSVLLLLGSLGIPDISSFPWPTPPPVHSIARATERLQALGAMDSKKEITQLGKRLTGFPLAPRYAKMLLQAIRISVEEKDILRHAIVAICAMSIPNLINPFDFEQVVGEVQKGTRSKMIKWMQCPDDLEGIFFAVSRYMNLENKHAAASSTSNPPMSLREMEVKFCTDNGFNSKQMQEVKELALQIVRVLSQKRFRLEECGVDISPPLVHLKKHQLLPAQMWLLKKCILHGLTDHIAVISETEVDIYHARGFEGRLQKNSNSARRRPRPKVVAYNEVIANESGNNYLNLCMDIDFSGLAECAMQERESIAGSNVFRQGSVLKTPAPRYVSDEDKVIGFFSPVYGPLDLQLPTVQAPLPKDNLTAVRAFAKAFVEGKVLPRLAKYEPLLYGGATSMLNNAPLKNGFISELFNRAISRKELMAIWKTNRKYLLEQYLHFLPRQEHDEITMIWPPI